MKRKNRLDYSALRIKIATNFVISVLVLSIGALCLSVKDVDVSTDGNEVEFYRSAGAEGVGVIFPY